MLDIHGRDVNYLRISVTDKCNLRCRYCMPEEGMPDKGHEGVLSLEHILRIVKASGQLGIKKVRLTGGEPLVRKNITKLIEDIAQIPEINDIAITTNGILFTGMAGALKNAGLTRVNFSLDTLVNEKFSYITRGGMLSEVRKAIDKALMLDMHPVKINVVLIKGFNDQEVLDFTELAYRYPLHVRFIEFMPIGDLSFYSGDKFIPVEHIRQQIERVYKMTPVSKTIAGNGPANNFQLSGGQGSVGFISPISNHFCGQCNRIRLTCDGRLRNCLYNNEEIDLNLALLNDKSDEQLTRLLVKSIQNKPKRHEMENGWGSNNRRKMVQIGG